MEPILDVVAGTGVILLLLAAAGIGRAPARSLAVVMLVVGVYAVHPIAVRQSLSAFIGGLQGPDVQTLAALLVLDGVPGCAGAALLLRERHRPARRRLRWLFAHQVGITPFLALFYLEMKAFHAVSAWSFSTTALTLCGVLLAAGLVGIEGLRRLLPDRDVRLEFRLFVHVAQVMLAAGLTAFALRAGTEFQAAPLEFGPLAALAGTAALLFLAGYGDQRRRQRRVAG